MKPGSEFSAQTNDRILKALTLLEEKAFVPVSDTRIPFYFNKTEIGHLEKSQALLLQEHFAFCCVTESREPQGAAFLFETSDRNDADRKFALISSFYRENGLVFAWRDEALAVVAAADFQRQHIFASIERAMCRPFGFATFAVHVNPFTKDGRLWVARRSSHKAINPGMWDNCAAGMVALGEDFLTAMEREAWEEAGLHCAQTSFKHCGHGLISRPVREGWMREFSILYETEVSDDFIPVNQDGEVGEFALLGPDEVLDTVEDGLFTFESALTVTLGLAFKAGLRKSV